jgi:hypothetical protein
VIITIDLRIAATVSHPTEIRYEFFWPGVPALALWVPASLFWIPAFAGMPENPPQRVMPAQADSQKKSLGMTGSLMYLQNFLISPLDIRRRSA